MKTACMVGLIVAMAFVPAMASSTDYIKGVSFGAMWWPEFDEQDVTYNLYRLLDVGCNSIILITDWYTDSYSDPTIRPFYRHEPGFPDTNWFFPTLYDHEIEFIVNTAHALGLSVMLKPHVETLNSPTGAPGRYALQQGVGRWDELFESYQQYMNYCAALCERLGVEILCLGCEMESMTHSAPDADRRWRDMIAEVRTIYSGKLTYSCAFAGRVANTWSSPNHVTFWDALDYIGFELYRGLTDKLDPSIEELRAGVRDIFDNFIEPLALQFDRPVLVPEANFMHCDGTNMLPYSPEDPLQVACDYEEHAACYQAVHDVIDEVAVEEDYFVGIYWWSGMLVEPNDDLTPSYAEPCIGTELWGTPAEDVVVNAWRGSNGWDRVPAADLGINVAIVPADAVEAGCEVIGVVDTMESVSLLIAAPASDWIFDHWEGPVDLHDSPIARIAEPASDPVMTVFSRSPCAPLTDPHDSDLVAVDTFSRDSVDVDAFWFAGGGSSCKSMKGIFIGNDEVMRYHYPADGSQKISLRFDPPFDASLYSGIQFTIRANVETLLQVEVASQDRGLHLQENADDWKSSTAPCSITVSADPRVFRFPFAAFTDPDWVSEHYPDATPGVNSEAIWEIEFLPVRGECVIDILQVAFY